MAWKRIVTASTVTASGVYNVAALDLLPAPATAAADGKILVSDASGYLDWGNDSDTVYTHPTNYSVFAIDSTSQSNYCASAAGLVLVTADEDECKCGSGGTWSDPGYAGECVGVASAHTENACLAASGTWTAGTCSGGSLTSNVWLTPVTGALASDEVLSHLYYALTTDAMGHVSDSKFAAAKRQLTLADIGYTGNHDANKYIHHTHYDSVTFSDEYSGGSNPVAYGAQSSITTWSNDGVTDRVLSGLDIQLTTTPEGHIAKFTTSYSERSLTLADLSYTGVNDADNYASWTLDTTGATGSAGDDSFAVISSDQTPVAGTSVNVVKFVGGTNMEVTVDNSNTNIAKLSFIGTADALGELTDLEAGVGLNLRSIVCSNNAYDNETACLAGGGTWNSTNGNAGDITSIDEANPNGYITLALADDSNSTLHAASTNAVTSTGHTHEITATSEVTASTSGDLLKTDANGHLTLQSLEVQGSFTTTGAGSVILNSSNLAIQDEEIQINMSSSSTYNNSDSAILFGGTSTAGGGKIINDISEEAFVFSDFTAADIASPANGGSTTQGVLRDIICGDIAAASIVCTAITAASAEFTGTADIEDLLLVDDVAFNPATAAGVQGQMQWDGTTLFLYV